MEFYGILGEKLAHSLSPRIHKMIFETIGVEGAYKLFEVQRKDLKQFTEAVKLLKIRGINVTIPYKEEIMKYIDVISPEAERIGAVNTIVLSEKNELYGYNTDYYGFGYMLNMHNVEVENKVVVILGNGGATKSAMHYLLDSKVKKIYIVSRSCDKKIHSFEGRVQLVGYKELEKIKGDILVNTTPVGMFPNDEVSLVESEVINNFHTIVDIIYNPCVTKLLSKAEALGKKTVGGLYMLIGQGVRAQELWQDISIDQGVIKDIYEVLNREFS